MLHPADEHLPFDLTAQVVKGQAFLFEGGLKLLLGFDLVFFLDVVDDALELLRPERVAQLAAALDQ